MVSKALNRSSLARFESLVVQLSQTRRPQWGGMTAQEMMAHLDAMMRLSLGEIEVPRLVHPVIGRPLGLLAVYVFTTWPKGKAGSKPLEPKLFPRVSEEFDQAQLRLLASLRRFVEALEADPKRRARHPIFGLIRLDSWSRIHALHCRHHLRQFGLSF